VNNPASDSILACAAIDLFIFMPLQPGDKLGPYEILAPIGAGGMGEVYKARDPRLNRIVAVKRLKSQHSARFEQEAQAIAALNHPHICQIHDSGPDYLVMEFVEGKPLVSQERPGPLRVEHALKLAVQIASAMEEAHGKGILHRDLKPANILVTVKGSAKILDFGLAKLMTETDADATQTIEGAILGTAAYMAPEQAEGKPLDERSDIFSFGAVLYEMLSGARAFRGNSTATVLSAVLRDDPAPLQAPPELQRIVAKCLAKQPRDRFASMGELREALEQISAQPVGRQPSIAVLPFANMSDDKEQEYFSDGLAEEIINALTQVKGLKVIARTSAFAFKGKNEDIRKIAETLGVSNVLEGSVRRAGNRLRITAQLIHAADGTHLWSQRYDRDMTDVFAIQDEISQAISEALQVHLAPRARKVNVEAYQLYLKGQYHRLRLTPESLAKAKEYFEQASAIDPNYALAYSGLAVYYYSLGVLGIKPAGDTMPLAKAAAEKALAIDPANSEAHSVSVIVAGVFEYDWKTAETHCRKAMAAEPVPPMVRFRYGMYYLIPRGRFAEAVEQGRMALEADPLSTFLHYALATSMFYARRYPDSIECAHRALEMDATFAFAWVAMGHAQLQAGFAQEAIASLKRGADLMSWDTTAKWVLAAAYRQAGDRERSRELAEKLAGLDSRALGAAIYYAASGEADAMFDALDAAYRQRDSALAGFLSGPGFDPYLADPRFRALLRRMNLV
jgi:TolB-like protein/Tfp pilus assembly protein PilF/tRNA A-37 threonylcarbamoyl transferase component Bud32